MKFGIWTSFAEKCITRLAETHAAKPAYFFFAAFNFAQRALCAAAIFLRADADMVRLGLGPSTFAFAQRAFCARLIRLRAKADTPRFGLV